jgi:hypothetical protein
LAFFFGCWLRRFFESLNADDKNNAAAAGFLIMLLWMPVEAICLANFGTTPGKAILVCGWSIKTATNRQWVRRFPEVFTSGAAVSLWVAVDSFSHNGWILSKVNKYRGYVVGQET